MKLIHRFYADLKRARLTVLLISVLPVFLAACASSNKSQLLNEDHPLAGRIWDVQGNRFIAESELKQRVLEAEYLLLGERHDNPVHHQYQVWAIKLFHEARKRASVAFEMIDDQQGVLLTSHRVLSAEEMVAKLNRIKNTWHYKEHYQAQFAATMAAGYQVVPANLNRQRLKQITSKGEDGLPEGYRKMLGSAALSERQLAALKSEIMGSHCNMLNEEMLGRLLLAQRVRDAVMTHSLMKIQTPAKILIAGSGHVRNDRGVPLYLKQKAKPAKVVTVGFMEVEEGHNSPNDYLAHWNAEALPFDYAWFTPQIERADFCEEMKEHLKRHKAKAGK